MLRQEVMMTTAQEPGPDLGAFIGPYRNSLAPLTAEDYPGDEALEERLEALVRWNAMAMVVRGNAALPGLGGHIATFASAATLYEVGFNHFWRGRQDDHPGDVVYIQGHASPGIYARAFLEGRLSDTQLANFRRELAPGGGLSSYPHPWLMPDFWQYPTVSMGLGPIQAIYQARFHRYLVDRGLRPPSDARIWAMIGDGETDEPETTAALTLAAREGLDNLVFVINANLQRLDGPVRGNTSIIQELAGRFAGCGWRVIKAVWGRDWDDLLARDTHGLLARRLEEAVDGDFQKYSVEPGSYMREHFFGSDPRLLALVEDLSDDQLRHLGRGGHDRRVVYQAYQTATASHGQPTVILAQTIKGYGLGPYGEGMNIAHNQKQLDERGLAHFRSRFAIPLTDDEIVDAPFYRPPADAPEMEYLHQRRQALGGFVPRRVLSHPRLQVPPLESLGELLQGTDGRPVSTTMAFVRLLGALLHDAALAPHLVPIVPDEARTLGMDGLFRQLGIYTHPGQRYTPVDSDMALYYREASDGQVLEEGITEAGALASFTAAGTAHATWGIPMIPLYAYYSMFGFQRVGDAIWAAADARARGFLLGATAGRTTLNGEGLQHQDGHSHLLASTVPAIEAYDPATAYELAVIVHEGLRRMTEADEDVIYYLTLYNENQPQPAMPDDPTLREGILRGLYRLDRPRGPVDLHLWGSGPLLTEARRAATLLAEDYAVTAALWSCTSPTRLYREGQQAARHNRLHPHDPPLKPWLQQQISDALPVVVTSDHVAALYDRLAPWLAGPIITLGTDGFGRSDSRPALRRHFGIDAEHLVVAALQALGRHDDAARAITAYHIDPEAADPLRA